MAYTMTPWGYDVDGTLPPLITREQFDAITGDKWATDERIESAIDAASAAIRDWCGWHVCPSMGCRAVLDTDGTASLWLPTTCLTSVDSVEVGGTTLDADSYQWSRIGQVLPDSRPCARLQGATVEYQAGADDAPADLVAIAAGLVVRGVALSYGVTSESAGGVSVSYAQGAAYAASAASLTDADRSALARYRVVRAHAS
jgi:hypothetical protein